MNANQGITAEQILDILFQKPGRITADLAHAHYKEDDRSYRRALNELRMCPYLSDVQVEQAIMTYRHHAPLALSKYLDQQLLQGPSPEDMAWGCDIEWDEDAFLGLRALDMDVETFENNKPLFIAEGNPAAQMIWDAVHKELEFFFPRPVYLRPGEASMEP